MAGVVSLTGARCHVLDILVCRVCVSNVGLSELDLIREIRGYGVCFVYLILSSCCYDDGGPVVEVLVAVITLVDGRTRRLDKAAARATTALALDEEDQQVTSK